MHLDVNAKSISCITSDTEKGAYAVFDVFDGLLLGRYANPAQPMKIVKRIIYIFLLLFLFFFSNYLFFVL